MVVKMLIIALFKNTQPLPGQQPLQNVFFAAVNHLSESHSKQQFPLTRGKGHTCQL